MLCGFCSTKACTKYLFPLFFFFIILFSSAIQCVRAPKSRKSIKAKKSERHRNLENLNIFLFMASRIVNAKLKSAIAHLAHIAQAQCNALKACENREKVPN